MNLKECSGNFSVSTQFPTLTTSKVSFFLRQAEYKITFKSVKDIIFIFLFL